MTISLYLGGTAGSRLSLPVIPVHADSRPQFKPPERSDHLADVHSEGYAWPGEYKIVRDQVRQATRVEWRGSDGSQYPRGKRTHHEQIIYQIENAHPEIDRVHGTAESKFELKNRTVVYRSDLEMHSDLRTSTMPTDGKSWKAAAYLAGNNSQRSSVVGINVEQIPSSTFESYTPRSWR
jgi:hypothetical protein